MKFFNEILNEIWDIGDNYNKWNGRNKDYIFFLNIRSWRLVDDDKCVRYKFFVKFCDLKWDKWIIVFWGFSVFYCMGRCLEIIDKVYNLFNYVII